MPLPAHLAVPSRLERAFTVAASTLNFYRLHVIIFTLVPLVFSGIMYASNTEYHIPYIDCLFMCTSSMTVTGLATINLSTLSPWQQVILWLQYIIGSPVFVSIIMVVVRRHFFRQRFRHVIKERNQRHASFSLARTMSRVAPAVQPLSTLRQRFTRSQPPKEDVQTMPEPSTPSSTEMKPIKRVVASKKPDASATPPKKKRKGMPPKFTKDMIKRIEGGGVGMVNPMGWYDASRAGTPENDATPTRARSPVDVADASDPPSPRSHMSPLPSPRLTDSPSELNPAEEAIAEEEAEDQVEAEQPRRHVPYANKPASDDAFPRSRTIAFDAPDDGLDHYRHDRDPDRDGPYFPRSVTMRSATGSETRLPRTGTLDPNGFPRTYSLRPVRRVDTRLSGFGGFPTPLEIAKTGFRRFFPQASNTLARSVTIPLERTVTGRGSMAAGDGAKEVPYISFSAVVGRNSRFKGLTEEQMEELGGVEYRALKALVWIVTIYFIAVQLVGFVIIAPYIAAGGRYDYVFDNQYRYVSIPWFALFQAVSAFSNSGMSLVDESMVPFQTAYLMIVVMIFLILAGNTCFPIFLRFFIWLLHKVVPSSSRFCETLKFLLDHPRRCFIYMFPSTQTWVLLLVMLSLTTVDWVSFLVLDIGTPAIESIPVGTRIAAGFLQSAAVRAAGFAIVPLNSLAPAVKVLYVIMMYISVYPVAMSVRSTNVYEERSLGLFHDEGDDDDFTPQDHGPQAVAKYLGWHARRQLAFDIWWLGFALWLVCIIERGALGDADNQSWFNIFSVIFELVSAYGTVGLSLGVDYDNYSLSGDFRKLSKLVVCAVMLRGRHRGLPVAIDRAVMLPRDFTAAEEAAFEQQARRTRRTGSYDPEMSQGGGAGGGGRASSPLASGRRPSHPSFTQTQPQPQTQTQGSAAQPESPTALHFSLPPPRSPRMSVERSPVAFGHERRQSVPPPSFGALETVEEGRRLPLGT